MGDSRWLPWLATGERQLIDGQRIFTIDLGPRTSPPLVLLHGFPGSSFDWHAVAVDLAATHRVIALDFLGYGHSAKPRRTSFSLFTHADTVVAVLRRLAVAECVLVGHDMGDTVLAELLARATAGQLPFQVPAAALMNGSIFIELAQLTAGQRALRALPPIALPIPPTVVRRSLAHTFPETFRDRERALDDLMHAIAAGHGERLLAKQIRYLTERFTYQPRWTAALADFPGELSALWGVLDPVAVPAMMDRLAELRPRTRIELCDDIGHWPAVEAPARVAQFLRSHNS